jgi:hypothetical protein
VAETKITLGDLRKKHNEIYQTSIRMSDVAQLANVSMGDVYIIEAGGFVPKHIVEKVVRAFSILSHQNIRIQDITVHVTDMTQQTR